MVARGEGRSCIAIKSVNGRNRGVVNVTYRPSLQEAFPRRNSRKPYLKQKGTVNILCRAYCNRPITVKNYKLTESSKEKHLLSRWHFSGSSTKLIYPILDYFLILDILHPVSLQPKHTNQNHFQHLK